MDNDDALPIEARFGPDRRLTYAYASAAAVAVILTGTTADAPGRILFGLAAIILIGYAATDLVYSPRLVATSAGLHIRTPTLTGDYPWSEVHQIRADSRQRAGLRLVTLEIDVADSLAVFSRRALGADPDTAARQLRLARPI